MADDFDPYYTWLGIPPKDQPPNYYRLLGVELFESNPDVIENAADRQMAHVRTVGSARHQDASQRVLNEIATARICLLSEEKRAVYDAELRAKIAPKVTREVRRAGPLPGNRSPGSPAPSGSPIPSGPLVRPLYSQGEAQEQEPAGSPLDISLLGGASSDGSTPRIAPGYSLAPQAPRSTRSPSRPRSALIPIIALGATLGLATVVGLWFLLRGGGSQGGAIVQNPVQNPDGSPAQGGPGKKTDDLGTKSPPEGKTSPTPEIKQPIETPQGLPQTPAGQTLHALRLIGRDHVELAGTKETEITRDSGSLTAELWVRINPATSQVALTGNAATSPLHPEVAEGSKPGWALSYVKGLRNKSGVERSDLFLSVGGVNHLGTNSQMGDGWHHVALCLQAGQPSTAFRVYLDGRRVMDINVPTASYKKSPAELCLGSPRYLPPGMPTQTDALVRGFRLSALARYSGDFSPATELKSDEQTLAALDFSRGQGDTLADSSGRGHTGRIVGAKWASGDAPLVSEKTPAGKPSTVNVDALPRYVLRFKDQARVELNNTVELLELLRAYTVEVWVRPKSANAIHPIVGNLILGKLNPEGADDKSLGWMLVTMHASPVGIPVILDRGMRGNGGQLPTSTLGQWVHLAVTFDGDRQVIFANGNSLSTLKAALPPASKSNLCLGVPPYGGERDRVRFDGDICGLRVSSGVRYQQAFTPAPRFQADAETLVLLDFDQPKDAEIRDVSGKNYHGRIVGAAWVPSDGAAANPSQETPNDSRQIDLLALIDLKQDRVAGNWSRLSDGLMCDTTQAARVMVPATPEGDYELAVEFTRRDGDESINLILPVGERQVQFVMHAYPHISVCAGLDLLDGQYAHRNASTVAGVRLENGRRYRAVAKVTRAEGNKVTIETHLDGKKLFSWTGAESSLALHPSYKMPSNRCFALLSYSATTTFHSARLRMLSGQLALLRKTSGQPSTGLPSATPIARRPPPDDAAQQRLRQEVQKTFANDYARLKLAEDRQSLAEKLRKQSAEGDFAADTRYVMLDEARVLAADGGSLSLAAAAIEDLLAKFDVPPEPPWSDALSRVVKSAKTNEARREVALACVEQAPQAFRAEHFAVAEHLLTQAATLMSQRDNQLSRRARDLAKQAAQAKDRLTQSAAAKEALAASADDAKARLTLGKYLCFVRDQWPAGLTHLAKSGDDALAKLAERDTAAPADGKEHEALADAWAAWSKTAPVGFDRDGGTARALYWYSKAMPNSDGLAKTRVGQRIEELAGKLVATESLLSRTPWLDGGPDAPRRWPTGDNNLVSMTVSRDGMLLVTGAPRGVVKVWHLASGRLLRQINGNDCRFLTLSPDGTLAMSSNSGKISLFDLHSGKPLRQIDIAQGAMLGLGLSPDGQFLIGTGFTGPRSSYIHIWEVKTGRRLRELTMSEQLTVSALSPDNRLAAVCARLGDRNYVVKVVELASGKELIAFNRHAGNIRQIVFSPSGKSVVSAADDGAWHWTVADGKPIGQLIPDGIGSVSFSADGRRLLTCGNYAAPELRRSSGELIAKLRPPERNSTIARVQLIPNGSAVVAVTGEGEVQFYRVPE